MSAPIPTECIDCGAPLHGHNLTQVCSECKLIARNRRMSGQPTDTAESVTLPQAINNVASVLGGRIIYETEANR